MPFIVVCNVFQERLAFCGKCLWSFWVQVKGAFGLLGEMPFIVVCNVIQERLTFYWKWLWSSLVRVWGASRIFLAMLFIVVCNVFQERLGFYGNVFDCPDFVFEEGLPFCGKCLLTSFLMCFKRVGHFTGMPLIVVSLCLKSFWHFTAYALDRRVQCVSRASCILLEMPLMVVCVCFRSISHFAGNAFDQPECMLKVRF